MQFLPALGFLIYLDRHGESTFTTAGRRPRALLGLRGTGHGAPADLLRQRGRAAAAVHHRAAAVPGADVFMFVLGLLAFHEPMPAERWAGFLLVWAALCLLTWDALHNAHRGRAALRALEAAEPPQAPTTEPLTATGGEAQR